MVKKLILLGLTLLIASCGVGLEDSTGPNVDREIKNEKLRTEYESVRGTYEGFIRIYGAERRFAVRLYLWVGEVQEAPLPGDLRPGIRVVLRGRLMQSEFIGDSDNLIMTGQFDSTTGRLRLDPDLEISKTSTGCRLGGQDPITVSGSFANSSVRGSILRNGQQWAVIEDMQRISRDVSAGSVLSEEEEYRRLQQTYEPVTGMYNGNLSRMVCNSTRSEAFELWLYIERVQEGTGLNGSACYVPRLSVRTLRNFAGELSDVKYRSINRFDPNTFLPQFTSDRSRINLDLANGRLTGEILTSGHWGQFDSSRYSERVVAPEDELVLARQRLERTYALFTGQYQGTNKAYEGPNWPVKLHLYVDEKTVGNVRTPILMGLYRRPDMSDETIGERRMEVSVAIDGCKPLLAMKSDANTIGGIPGTGIMRYSATFTNGTLEGELVDHRGPQGILTVRKK